MTIQEEPRTDITHPHGQVAIVSYNGMPVSPSRATLQEERSSFTDGRQWDVEVDAAGVVPIGHLQPTPEPTADSRAVCLWIS